MGHRTHQQNGEQQGDGGFFASSRRVALGKRIATRMHQILALLRSNVTEILAANTCDTGIPENQQSNTSMEQMA